MPTRSSFLESSYIFNVAIRLKGTNSTDPVTLEDIHDIPQSSLTQFEDAQGSWVFRTSSLSAIWIQADLETAIARNPFTMLPLPEYSRPAEESQAIDVLREMTHPTITSTSCLIVSLCVFLQTEGVHICPQLLKMQSCGRLKRIFSFISELFANNFEPHEKIALCPHLGVVSTFIPYRAPWSVWRLAVVAAAFHCAGYRSLATRTLRKRGAHLCWIAFDLCIPEMSSGLSRCFVVL
uniref:Uncharacterized protein n=1 Tax=viral metagenome TaxID=1070528 RepID=A0A6C0C236_9ZZZZ